MIVATWNVRCITSSEHNQVKELFRTADIVCLMETHGMVESSPIGQQEMHPRKARMATLFTGEHLPLSTLPPTLSAT